MLIHTKGTNITHTQAVLMKTKIKQKNYFNILWNEIIEKKLLS